MFHAAPAMDFLRVEIETRVARTYEWVLHHTASPKDVGESSGAYRRAASQQAMQAGTWWHDDVRNDLHVLLRADADTDRIVNISF